MNDYEGVINAYIPITANINGDTAVRWMLEVKQKFRNLADEGDMETLDMVYNGISATLVD